MTRRAPGAGGRAYTRRASGSPVRARFRRHGHGGARARWAAGRCPVRTIVKGKNIDVAEPVRRYAERKLARLGRFLDDRSDALVELSVERHRSRDDSRIVEVTLVIDGRTLRSRAAAVSHQAAIDTVVDKLERQAIDHREKPRVRSRPVEEKQLLRELADGTSEAGPAAPDRQDEALRDRADVRGGRDRGDGRARPQLLRVRQRGDGAPRGDLPPRRRRLRAHRADRGGQLRPRADRSARRARARDRRARAG